MKKPNHPFHWVEEKCIHCNACIITCKKIQGIGAIRFEEKKIVVDENICTHCGQCVVRCPTDALKENNDVEKVKKSIEEGRFVVAQIAPSVRASFGEYFGIEGNFAKKLVGILKDLGFSKVFDTNLGADLVTYFETKELIERIESNNTPLISSCCPSWVYFAKQNGYEKYLSKQKSPQRLLGEIIKKIYGDKDPFVVSIMPCIAKKTEALWGDEIDAVITTRELIEWVKESDIKIENIEEQDFDDPLGKASVGGTIFGATGGVAESVLRTYYEMVTGKNFEESGIDTKEMRKMKGVKEISVVVAGKTLRIGIANGLSNVKKLLGRIEDFDFIEMMACPGGCVGGSGQPKNLSFEKIKSRAKILHEIGKENKYSSALRNPAVWKVLEKVFKL